MPTCNSKRTYTTAAQHTDIQCSDMADETPEYWIQKRSLLANDRYACGGGTVTHAAIELLWAWFYMPYVTWLHSEGVVRWDLAPRAPHTYGKSLRPSVQQHLSQQEIQRTGLSVQAPSSTNNETLKIATVVQHHDKAQWSCVRKRQMSDYYKHGT
jgi:hypothetical protein